MKNLDTLQETENQNVNTKSLILAPFNSTLKRNDSWKMADDLKIENEVMKICGKVKEAIRNYELNNNGEIDNGFLINLENQSSQNNKLNTSKVNSIKMNNSKVNSGVSSKASLNSQNDFLSNKLKIGSNKNSNSNSNANLNILNLYSQEEENKLCRKFTGSKEYLQTTNNIIIISKKNLFYF